jgi:hypothetical protein
MNGGGSVAVARTAEPRDYLTELEVFSIMISSYVKGYPSITCSHAVAGASVAVVLCLSPGEGVGIDLRR